MPITIELPEDIFSEDEREKLMNLFQVDNQLDFSDSVRKITIATINEYKEMFLGMGLPSRADEIQQHRLYFLIKYFFEDIIPSEAQISSMFQLTQSRSRSLIRFVLTRFHYDLERQLLNTLRETIESAQLSEDGSEYRVVIQSDNVLEELNRIIGIRAPRLDPIRRIRNMSRTYSISVDSFENFCENFGIRPDNQNE
jgi:predicted DNA binding protein